MNTFAKNIPLIKGYRNHNDCKVKKKRKIINPNHFEIRFKYCSLALDQCSNSFPWEKRVWNRET